MLQALGNQGIKHVCRTANPGVVCKVAELKWFVDIEHLFGLIPCYCIGLGDEYRETCMFSRYFFGTIRFELVLIANGILDW